MRKGELIKALQESECPDEYTVLMRVGGDGAYHTGDIDRVEWNGDCLILEAS